MSGPAPAVAATRVAVRSELSLLPAGSTVLVGCSGGPDSLALAAAVAFEADRAGLTAVGVVVDHGLQPGSSRVAQTAAAHCRELGLAQVEVVRVEVVPAAGGPEEAARLARFAALDEAADRHGAVAILLGHTRDDQAEQVLLGLARGSGSRSLSGMPRRRGLLVRPFIGVTRDETEAACAAYGVEPWQDPHNDDTSFTRVRARALLRELERELGPGVRAALARSAEMIREDADHLEDEARSLREAIGPTPWAVSTMLAVPRALRTRLWRILAVEAGSGAGQLSSAHVESLDALLTCWHGQGPLQLPGHVRASRSGDLVRIVALEPAAS
ncbi:tRNA lysidine(34) synthetase TilS [Dermatophilaceae bacterium Soc4.6]